MLSAKELMQLEDFLTAEQSCVKTFGYMAGMVQDSGAKQLLQQVMAKNQQHYQTLTKHLNAGQNLQ